MLRWQQRSLFMKYLGKDSNSANSQQCERKALQSCGAERHFCASVCGADQDAIASVQCLRSRREPEGFATTICTQLTLHRLRRRLGRQSLPFRGCVNSQQSTVNKVYCRVGKKPIGTSTFNIDFYPPKSEYLTDRIKAIALVCFNDVE